MSITKRHRYPWAVIEMCLRLHRAFHLSYRTIALKLQEHGIEVTHKTVFEWVQKFSFVTGYSQKPRKSQLKDWAMEESLVTCNGKNFYMYRAHDTNDKTLSVILRDKRHKSSALAALKKSVQEGF
jgi:transposase-like protein